MTDLDIVLAKTALEFPKFKIVYKQDSWLMKLISVYLRCITLGQLDEFMTKFITTVGYVVYVPAAWVDYAPAQRAVILRHERVHMRQRAKYGMFLFTLLYVFLPLPGGLAYFRAKFEMEAYAESMIAMCELYVSGCALVQSEVYREATIGYFTGPAYFWMWPFRKTIETWFDAAMKKAVASQCNGQH